MENEINSILKDLKPSGLRKFFDIANEMESVISLSIGEPDFQTPWHIKQAGMEAIEKGKTFYSPSAGLIALRQSISKYLDRRFNLVYEPKTDVIVTVGASEGLDMTFRALLNPDDEVLIVQPSFVCYEPMVLMALAKPVILDTHPENNFKLTLDQLQAKLTSKTKMLILPYPSNPTGAVMTYEDLLPIAEFLKDKDIIIVSDEIYAELNYSTVGHASIAQFPYLKDKVVLINGFSKSYAMTGWRIGYVAAHQRYIAAILKLHQYAVMCASMPSQIAAIEAMENGDPDIEHMRNEYNLRRRYIVERLNKMGLACFEPEGAFYVFPDIRSTKLSSEEFCERLLFSQHVAVIPGNAFGNCGEGFIRISYSYSIKHITEALDRIESFVQTL
ncbi:MAG: aminotransferase class I/II-fold pyridoxal phosphate-dependent enzyme [Erysipelotrichaceae bacterium]